MADWRLEKLTLASKCEFFWSANSDLHGDVTFLVGPGEEQIKGFKILLMVTSPVFETMYGTTWSTARGQDMPIKLPHADPVVFRHFLRLLLNDNITTSSIKELKLPIGQILELFFLSKEYLVQNLQDTLEKFIMQKLSLDNVLEIYEKIWDKDVEKLETETSSFLATNAVSVLQQDYFLTISKQVLLKILANDMLLVKEIMLFNAVHRWAKSHAARDDTLTNGDKKQKKVGQILREFLFEIRLPLVTCRDITTEVVPTGVLTDKEALALLMYLSHTEEERKSLSGPMLQLSLSLSMSTEARHPPFQRLVLSHQIYEHQNQYTCTAIQHYSQFKANKKVRIVGLGFCGPLHRDCEYEVGVHFTNHNTGVSTAEERKSIFAQEKTIFYFALTTPVILEENICYKVCFNLNGASTGNTVGTGQYDPIVTQDGIEFQWWGGFPQIAEIRYVQE